MKKFLFTLAALVGFGFAANATATFGYNVENNEVTLGAGETQEIAFVLTSIDEIVAATNWSFEMRDPNGAIVTGTDRVYVPFTYGTSRRHQYAAATGITTDNEAAVATSDGQHTTDATMEYTGVVTIICTNTATNVVWYNDEVCPANVLVFKVTVGENWEDEYADFVCVRGGISFETREINDPTIIPTLRIKNKDYSVTPDKTPFEATATIGDAQGYNVPLHYEANDPAAKVTVTVNNTEVDVTWDENGNATLVLGEAPDYGTYDIVLKVEVGNTDKYEGDDVTATKTVVIAQPAAPQPMISFNTQEDGSVTVVVTNATSYTITVNGEPWTGGDNIPQTYEDQVIVVNATNHIDGYADNTNIGTTTLLGKEKEAVNPPTITQETGDAAVTVTVTPDPNTDGELVYDGAYSYIRGDEDYTVTVTAYTTEGDTCQASGVTTFVVVVPKLEPTPPTSIDELINGKNVAGVRYFNVAGQEMQEANGMTIVVVTYTDGTTATVKVMK